MLESDTCSPEMSLSQAKLVQCSPAMGISSSDKINILQHIKYPFSTSPCTASWNEYSGLIGLS